uniref:TLDc domain-containing protein n=1 Tax=Plectus sambesii TaxID=2011161 RepID=A0A914WEK7_9BILA
MGNEKSVHGHHHNQAPSAEHESKQTHSVQKYQAAFDRLRGNKAGVDEAALQERFGKELGHAMWMYLAQSSSAGALSLEQLSLKAGSLMGTSTDVYVKLFIGDSVDKGSVLKLLHVCRAAAGAGFEPSDERFTDQLVESIVTECSNYQQVAAWKNRVCPGLCSSLQKLVLAAFSDSDLPLSAVDYNSDVFSQFQMWFVQCTLPPLYFPPQASTAQGETANKHWSPLYSSAEHGISVSRFEGNVFGYRGPTVTLLRLNDGSELALAVDQEWRSSTQQWGGADAVAMQLLPSFRLVDDLSGGVYLNFKMRGSPLGLTVGRDARVPLFHVDADLGNIAAIEVWGCSGSATLQDQQRLKQWQSRQVEKHKKVPLPGKWEDNPDRYLLEMAGFGGNMREHHQHIELYPISCEY